MSDLPVPVRAAGALLSDPKYLGSPGALRELKDWGYEQIDAAYPDNPLKPLARLRRAAARAEWTRTVQQNGRQLRGVMAQAQVEALTFELRRRMELVLAEDRERARRSALQHDTQLEVDRHAQLTQIEQGAWKEREGITHAHAMEQLRAQFAHALAMAKQAAKAERKGARQAHERELGRIAALAEAAASSGSLREMDAQLAQVRRLYAEIEQVETDPRLSEEQRHRRTQPLLSAAELAMRGGAAPKATRADRV